MSNNYFRFKQFTVYHHRCSMRVNTDGVLLGAWADVNNIGSALDVGTGSGLIALMISQRSEAFIDAVEIDGPSSLQASENVDHSPWKNRIKVFHDSFRHFASVCGRQYDLIVSNPPYFRDALKPEDKRKSKARHDVELGFEELLYHTSLLLTEQGRFCVIIPFAEKDNFTDLATFQELHCHRMVMIRSTPMAGLSRIMMDFRRDRESRPEKTELVIRRGKGEYSPEYVELTRDFYLAF